MKTFKTPCCRSVRNLAGFASDGTVVIRCLGEKFGKRCDRLWELRWIDDNWDIKELKWNRKTARLE